MRARDRHGLTRWEASTETPRREALGSSVAITIVGSLVIGGLLPSVERVTPAIGTSLRVGV